MDAAANKAFLERVMDVPGPNGPGYLGVFTHLKNEPKPGEPIKNGGRDFIIGWPCKTVDEIISKGHFIRGSTAFFDTWYCTSTQSETGVNSRGKPKAIRLAKNAIALKALWVDVDIGNKPGETKHYEDVSTALDAMLAFNKAVGMPTPSALVNSGGGLHVYWISAEPLAPADWEPYAQGLKALLVREGVKCDAGLTADAARILRVPGTLNHKYDPPKPVVLMSLGQDYKFESVLSFLKNVSNIDTPSARYTTQASQFSVNVIEPGADFTPYDPALAAIFAGLNPNEQLNEKLPHLVDPAPIMEKCAFYADALATGGKDHDNPLWNLALLGAAFMEDGNAIAHQVSKGHPGYTALETQAQFDRKLAERSNGTVGYPSCGAIESAGCKSCATCPLKPQGKSPLNIRPPRVAFTAAVIQQSPAAKALLLPDGYDFDANGIINQIEQKKDKFGVVQDTWYPLFWCQIDDAWAQKDPDMLHLHVSTDKGNWAWTAIAPEAFVGAGGDKALVKAKIMIRSENKARVEAFLMGFLAKMKAAMAMQAAVGFGWYRPRGLIEGFAFGGRVFLDNGRDMPAGLIDAKLQKNYLPTGDVKAWFHAWDFIKMQRRPDLEIGTIVAFAAPLMELSGQNGAMLSVMGERGSGKTHAMELGCAVWGHPLKTRESENSTDKSVESRLASISNLPIYWDEVTDDAVRFKLLKLTNILTAGSQGDRLTSSREHIDRGTWATILCINGNALFKDYIVKKQRAHGASLNRVLELWVPRVIPNQVGQITNTSIPDRAKQKLQHNFGHVGYEYARFLARNHIQVAALMETNSAMLSTKFSFTKEERMWLSLCTSLLTAAEIANQMNVDGLTIGFDVNGLLDLIERMLIINRAQRADAHVTATDTDYGEDYLTQFIKDRSMQAIWTNARGAGVRGKQAPVEWFVLMPNASRPTGIQLRWDKGDNTLRFSKKNFEEWCARDEGRDASSIVSSLKQVFDMKSERRVLGVNTPFASGMEWVYMINVTGFPELEAVLNQHQPNMNQDLGASTSGPTSPPPEGEVVTGLTAAAVARLATSVVAASKVKI